VRASALDLKQRSEAQVLQRRALGCSSDCGETDAASRSGSSTAEEWLQAVRRPWPEVRCERALRKESTFWRLRPRARCMYALPETPTIASTSGRRSQSKGPLQRPRLANSLGSVEAEGGRFARAGDEEAPERRFQTLLSCQRHGGR
jgi:hypothetical protein